jgi:hypothetical protein
MSSKKEWKCFIDILCNNSAISITVFESILVNISIGKTNKYTVMFESGPIHKETMMDIYQHINSLVGTPIPSYTIQLNQTDTLYLILTKKECDAIVSCERGHLDIISGLPIQFA